VLRRLKSELPLALIPVAIVSIVGRDNESQLRQAAAILDKPFEREELFALLNRLLASDGDTRLEATA
jgi:CheY-like chemotaxis protein